MSTRTALTVVGGIVGAYFGYPQLGLMIGALVGGAVDPQEIQGPKIGEVNVQTSQEGAPRTIVYGTYACFGNVIQTGQIVKVEVEESQGKGGPEVTSERAYRTFAIRICEGPIGGVLRVWEDNKLVYDVRPGSAMLAESAKWASNKVFYNGDESQLPDPTLVATVNPDTPAYRGSAYFVAILEDQTDRRGSIAQYRCEVAASTSFETILAPLVVNDWTGGAGSPPQHYQGETTFTFDALTSTNFATISALAAADLATARPAAAYSTQYTSFGTGVTPRPNTFTGGGTLSIDPEFVYYYNAADVPTVWQNSIGGAVAVCTPLQLSGAVPDDDVLYATTNFADTSQFFAVKLFSHALVPSSGPYSENVNNCTNYAPSGGFFPVASGSPVIRITGKRIPTAPDGGVKVTGTAKQLCAIEYRSGVLYQNALGPVLLPGDPDYSNSSFWDAQRDAAVAAGTMHADVSYPVVVAAYAELSQTVAGEPVELGLIVTDIHNRCGSLSDTLDVSELTDLVAGLGLAGDYTGASAIDAVRPVYNFDKSLHDLSFYYPKRGAAVIETLTIDDLTEVPDTTKREQALDVPNKFHLRYQHAASGYAPVKATVPRTPSPDFLTTGEASYEIPVVLNEDQAMQCADRMYKIMRTEQDGTTEIYVPISVGAKYAEGNCIGLSLRGRTDRYRIEQIDFVDWKLKLILKPDRQSAYTSNLTGVPIPPPTLPPSTIVGDTELAILDIPARVDSEDDLNYLVAVDGALDPWHGARYQRSLDGGATYSTIEDITTASVMGELLEDVPEASVHYTDTTNTVRVHLYRATHSLESITEVQFLSEGGAFALEKADGSWEVMQYRDAVEHSDGSFTLSTLHRGRLNSGPSEHLEGARFVRLDRPTHIPAQAAWIGQSLTHRAISLGETADDTDNEQTQVFVGRSQIEWPVADLELSRDISDVITWSFSARHRFGSDDAPIASINFRGFRITITDGSDSVTFDTVSQDGTYDASALGSPVTFSVSAINRITGAGPVTTESI